MRYILTELIAIVLYKFNEFRGILDVIPTFSTLLLLLLLLFYVKVCVNYPTKILRRISIIF